MKTTQDDGGPAFPSKMLVNRFATEETAQQLIGADGMSLRDWFAGMERMRSDEDFTWELCEALAGPRPNKDRKTDPVGWEIWRATWRAKIRFIRADAMLSARKEGA